MVKTVCPKCDTPLRAPDAYAGKSPRCPRCETRVPARAAAGARPRASAHRRPPSPPPASKRSAEDALLDDLLTEVGQQTEAPKPATRPGKAAARVKGGRASTPARAQPGQPVLSRKPAKAKRSVSPALITFVISAIVIAGAGAYMMKVVYERRESANAQDLIDDLDTQLSSIRQSIGKGDEALKNKQYAEAKKGYEAAGRTASAIAGRLQEALGAASAASAQETLLSAQNKVRAYLTEIQSKLKGDELLYGSQGLVPYDGQWVTPQKRDELHRKKMMSLGKTWREEFKQWMTAEEYNRAKGLVFFREQWMTKKQQARILADEKARKQKQEERRQAAQAREQRRLGALRKLKEERERKAAEAQAERLKKYPPDAPAWIVDNFEEGKPLWTAQTWGNPCTLVVVTQKGSKRLQLSIERGMQDKAAIGRSIDLDFTSRDRIAMDVVNMSKGVLRIALAIHSDRWYETRMKSVRTGEGRVEFALKSGDFKSEATQWQHTTKVQNLDAVRRVFLLIYTKRDATLYVDNVVAERVN